MSIKATTINVANDAVNQLEVASEYISWLSSLSWAVNHSIKNGHGDHALRLAGAAQFLADDYFSVIDHEIKKLNEQLSELDVRA
ncbi:hypothetical protein [Pseudomonas serbica]